MKVYLAGRFSRREEFLRYAAELNANGIEVTSRWITGDHGNDDEEFSDSQLGAFAQEDLDDVRDADVLVNFTEPPDSNAARGGRHVEFGYALGIGTKRIIAVGFKENIFHRLDGIEFYPSWDEAKVEIKPD